jgi:hypothetical protein
MFRPFMLAGALLAFSLHSAASQQPTQAQRDAIRASCRSDFMANCASVTPGGKEALECLLRNQAKLSPACNSAVSAIAAPAPAAAAPAPSAPAPAAAEPAAASEPAPKAAASQEASTISWRIAPGSSRATRSFCSACNRTHPTCRRAANQRRPRRKRRRQSRSIRPQRRSRAKSRRPRASPHRLQRLLHRPPHRRRGRRAKPRRPPSARPADRTSWPIARASSPGALPRCNACKAIRRNCRGPARARWRRLAAEAARRRHRRLPRRARAHRRPPLRRSGRSARCFRVRLSASWRCAAPSSRQCAAEFRSAAAASCHVLRITPRNCRCNAMRRWRARAANFTPIRPYRPAARSRSAS